MEKFLLLKCGGENIILFKIRGFSRVIGKIHILSNKKSTNLKGISIHISLNVLTIHMIMHPLSLLLWT